MLQSSAIGLDNIALRGRVRGYVSRSVPRVISRKVSTPSEPKLIRDFGERLPKKFVSQSATQLIENEQELSPFISQQTSSFVKKSRAILKKVNTTYALSVGAVVFIVAGSMLGVNSFKVNQQIEAQVKAISSDVSSGNPSSDTNNNGVNYDETPVASDTLNSYVVAPDVPRLLKIPALNVGARVKRVGVDANNTVQAPGNIFDVGWYDGSAKPGENGAMFIDGHVSGWTEPGALYNLKNLKNGDEIIVERGDGQVFKYSVVAVDYFDANNVDMNKALRPYISGKQGLNIMTCTGRFNNSQQQYEQRVVVYSILQ